MPSPTRDLAALTPTMLKVMRHAAERERANYCPMFVRRGVAEKAILNGLTSRGFVFWDCGGSVPRINAAGRAALAKAEDRS